MASCLEKHENRSVTRRDVVDIILENLSVEHKGFVDLWSRIEWLWAALLAFEVVLRESRVGKILLLPRERCGNGGRLR